MSEKHKTNKKEKPYPSEFKESAVKLATGSKNPIAQTARELGVNVHTLYSWIEKYSSPEAAMRKDDHHFDEIKRLKKELSRVTEERDLLKKAAAYFAREAR
jgi:transposase